VLCYWEFWLTASFHASALQIQFLLHKRRNTFPVMACFWK
jgi:hypothetical protein